MTSLLSDLRFGARMLLKNPAVTFIAVLALTLGIGANTAIFTVVNAVMLGSLPYANPEQLVTVWERREGREQNVITWPTSPIGNNRTMSSLTWRHSLTNE